MKVKRDITDTVFDIAKSYKKSQMLQILISLENYVTRKLENFTI